MAFELKQLRQVVALAEHGSFVRAAAALHMSQPALSRSIQNLEARFGSELFLRSSGGAVPSDLGRLYIERARDLLRMADELDREAVSHGNLRTGRVAVGGGPYPAEAVLARAAAKFVQQYPGVVVQVLSRNWDELARQLRSRELDFFVAETSTLQREPDLEISPMPAAHPLYFVARAGHPLAANRDAIRVGRAGMASRFAKPRTAAHPRSDACGATHHLKAIRGLPARSRRSSATQSPQPSESCWTRTRPPRRSRPALRRNSRAARWCCSGRNHGCTCTMESSASGVGHRHRLPKGSWSLCSKPNARWNARKRGWLPGLRRTAPRAANAASRDRSRQPVRHDPTHLRQHRVVLGARRRRADRRLVESGNQ